MAKEEVGRKPLSTKKCYYYGCTNNNRNCSLAFFSFPTKNRRDYDRFHSGIPQYMEWLMRSNAPKELYDIPLEKLRNRTICAKHFRKEDFVNSLRRKLNPLALPIHYRKADTVENTLTDISNGRTSGVINEENSAEEKKDKIFPADMKKEKLMDDNCHLPSSSILEDPLKTDALDVRNNEHAQLRFPIACRSIPLANGSVLIKPNENSDEGEFILGL